jgi:hypothetical protein
MSSNIEFVRSQVSSLIQSIQDMNILRKFYQIRDSNDLYQWLELDSLIQSQQNKNENIKNFLENNIPFFKHNPQIFEDLSNPEKNTKLVAGHVQSGKTAVICGLASYLVGVLRIPTIVVVRNYTADYQQLSRKFSSRGRFGPLDILVHYAKDVKREHIFSANYPALTICLEHQTQLKKVVDAYETRATPFCVIADEADSICYKVKLDKERITLFQTLREYSSQFIAVTATAFDMLYIESKLFNTNIYHVPVPEKYKGIEHESFSLKELNKKFDFKLSHTQNPMIWTLSPDMEQFYAQILNTPMFRISLEQEDEKELIQFQHPVICLQKTETEIKKQLQCMAALIRHPIFGKEFVVIAYNGEGVYAYSPKGLDRDIPDFEGELCRGEQPLNSFISDCPVMHYKSLGIGDILQYFKRHSLRDQTTHIVIIAGQMVGRGLNIVSNDYQWHLTHQILKVSDTATCADITQSCRVFGVYSDEIPTTLYCLQKDAMSLKQSYELQKRIFQGAELSEATENILELCKQIKMFVGHVPRRRTTKKCPEPEWNLVAKEREQYGEVDEKEEKESVGEYHRVLPERLAPREAEMYKYALDYLQDKTGQWIERSKVVEHAVRGGEVDNTVRGFFNSMCSSEKKKHIKTTLETQSGLLFKKSGDRWFMRLN